MTKLSMSEEEMLKRKYTRPYEERIAELESENEQIKNSDTLCKLIGEQKRKITELEDKLANADYQLEGRDLEIKELKKENAELKESNKMLEQGYVWHDYDAGEDCYEDTHEGKWVKRDEVYQLTKAKEIIKKFSEFINNDIEYDPEHPQEHTVLWNKLCEETEQFLKDCDIDNAIQQANKGLDFDKIADEMEQDLKDSEVEK